MNWIAHLFDTGMVGILLIVVGMPALGVWVLRKIREDRENND